MKELREQLIKSGALVSPGHRLCGNQVLSKFHNVDNNPVFRQGHLTKEQLDRPHSEAENPRLEFND